MTCQNWLRTPRRINHRHLPILLPPYYICEKTYKLALPNPRLDYWAVLDPLNGPPEYGLMIVVHFGHATRCFLHS